MERSPSGYATNFEALAASIHGAATREGNKSSSTDHVTAAVTLHTRSKSVTFWKSQRKFKVLASSLRRSPSSQVQDASSKIVVHGFQRPSRCRSSRENSLAPSVCFHHHPVWHADGNPLGSTAKQPRWSPSGHTSEPSEKRAEIYRFPYC